ncbi:hypothetical protein T439DRAFT_360326 [Meredithblackwellia eburnea MCA 4105]
MGNNPSSQQGQGGGGGRSRPSHPGSPIVRNSPLPDDGGSHTRTAKPSRRKKSIELSDVDPSLSFSTSSHRDQNAALASVRAAHRRKMSENLTAANDGSGDEDVDAPSGTLRGAMQGKAEHVVYGPRRPNEGIITTTIPSGIKPATIALPTPTLIAPTPIADPDDTLHPGFTASPRLTSDVLLSSDKMPVIISPVTEEVPTDSPFGPTDGPTVGGASSGGATVHSVPTRVTTSLGEAAAILAPSSVDPPPITALEHDLLPPHTSPPFPPSTAPSDTVVAPVVPTQSLPLSPDNIPSGTGVLGSPVHTPNPGNTPRVSSPAVLLPPTLLNAPVAAIPIPLLSVPSATIAASLMAAAVDVGAGVDGVPTLIKWKDEDGQGVDANGKPFGPKEVFVTGTFAKGWKTKIELRKTNAGDFSALISLPPGPHRLKFIVDNEWKASKHLQLATDADGNLINYLHVNGTATKTVINWSSAPGTPGHSGTATPQQWLMPGDDDDFVPQEPLDDAEWTQEIPPELVEWGDWEAERDAIESSSAFQNAVNAGQQPPAIPPPPPSSNVPPPTLPAQLEKGPLNHAAYVTQGSGDDNSILPKPDHSVINHLAASPIKGGFLSVGVTTRYKRKFVTIVYYKSLA